MPIYKSGPPDDVSNYRPIALTSVFSKVMERVLSNEVTGYFLQHGLISKQQHGFLTRRSTVTDLVETLNDWTLDVNTRQCVTVAYIDYKKAFDSVCHNTLFIKLSTYEIASSLLLWIKDFLFDRSQVTQVGAERSRKVLSAASCKAAVWDHCCSWRTLTMSLISCRPTALINCSLTIWSYTLLHILVKTMRLLYRRVSKSFITGLMNGSLLSRIRSALLRQLVVQTVLFVLKWVAIEYSLFVLRKILVHVCSDLSFASHVNTIAAKAHVRACSIHQCFISRDAVTLRLLGPVWLMCALYSNMLRLYGRRSMLIK